MALVNKKNDSKKCVLVVDDESAIQRFICISLRASGYEVITANNGNEALEMVDVKKPDLVLLDVFMQGMDGLEVLKRIRTSSSMPVLMTSARNFIAEKAMGLGANDFISKPFTPDFLIKKIQTLLPLKNSHGKAVQS